MHPRVKAEDGYNSQSDGNIPLAIVFKRNPAHSLLHEDGLLHGKQSQAFTKIKFEPIGGPKSGGT